MSSVDYHSHFEVQNDVAQCVCVSVWVSGPDVPDGTIDLEDLLDLAESELHLSIESLRSCLRTVTAGLFAATLMSKKTLPAVCT